MDKTFQPSYLPPENALRCSIAWGDVAVSLGLAVTVSFGRSLGRAGINEGSIRRLCLDHGLS